MLLNCGAGEDSWESLGLEGRRSNQSILKKIVLGVHWKDWCWSWNSNTWPHDTKNQLIWKDPDFGKIEGRRRGQQRMRWLNGITQQWTWVWVNSQCRWWTGKPGVLRFMGSQRVGHDWDWIELNQTESFQELYLEKAAVNLKQLNSQLRGKKKKTAKCVYSEEAKNCNSGQEENHIQAHQNKERKTFTQEKLGGSVIKENIFERNWEFKV